MDINEPELVVLQEKQGPHVDRLEEILTEQYCAFDMSMMGSGKTYTTTALALRLEFEHVIVVCPVPLEAKWKTMSRFGVNLTRVISYPSLISRKGCVPKHGLLDRIDIDEETFFKPTDLLKELISEGCLIVFDEAQKFKNKNETWKACQVLSSTVLKIGGTSRFVLLSGTPIDKEEHAINMMQMMGFIQSPRLYMFDKEERRLRLYGAQELIDYCKTVDLNLTLEFLRLNPFTADNVRHNCYLMFQQILKRKIATAMPSPVTKIDSKNGYYNIYSQEDRKLLTESIEHLSTKLRFNEREGTVDTRNGGFGAIQKCLMGIEKSKINSMARITRNTLNEHPNGKVCVFVNYTEGLFRLAELLKDFNPIVMYGAIQPKKRQALFDMFQAPNLKSRLLIGNLTICSAGIDLDDKDGRFPRYAFASPNYTILDLHQLTRRFVRLDSKSNATFRFFYGKIGRKETSILSALVRKTQVMKDTLEMQVDEGVVFPGDYKEDIEGGSDSAGEEDIPAVTRRMSQINLRPSTPVYDEWDEESDYESD